MSFFGFWAELLDTREPHSCGLDCLLSESKLVQLPPLNSTGGFSSPSSSSLGRPKGIPQKDGRPQVECREDTADRGARDLVNILLLLLLPNLGGGVNWTTH